MTRRANKEQYDAASNLRNIMKRRANVCQALPHTLVKRHHLRPRASHQFPLQLNFEPLTHCVSYTRINHNEVLRFWRMG